MEVEDTILAELQKQAAAYPTAKSFQEMFDKIGASPDRRAMLQLVKKHFPDAVIPEIDAAQPVYDAVAEVKAELAKEREDRAKEKEEAEKQRAERTAQRTIAEERRKLREDGWDDEGIEKVETYMRERGNPDYASAAAYVRSQVKDASPLPTTFAGQRFDWFSPPKDGADDHRMLMKNPRQFQDNQIAQFLRETKARGRAA